jgi:hypothetical protein
VVLHLIENPVHLRQRLEYCKPRLRPEVTSRPRVHGSFAKTSAEIPLPAKQGLIVTKP